MNALTRTMIDLSAALSKAAAPKQPSVFVCAKRYGTNDISGRPETTITVLVGRDYFEVDERELSLLQSGLTPDDLGLYPLEDA